MYNQEEPLFLVLGIIDWNTSSLDSTGSPMNLSDFADVTTGFKFFFCKVWKTWFISMLSDVQMTTVESSLLIRSGRS